MRIGEESAVVEQRPAPYCEVIRVDQVADRAVVVRLIPSHHNAMIQYTTSAVKGYEARI
jgi:hypothetical protein